MKKVRRLKIEEVAAIIGVSTKTINFWYAWKRKHYRHPLAKLLPNYKQNGSRQTRYWNPEDVYKLAEFQANLPKGRNGILGDVTQKYYRKNRKETKNGKSKK